MHIIVKSHANRIADAIMLLFLFGLGIGLVELVGGPLAWLFCTLFLLFSLLPLDSVVRPETCLLAIDNGILFWEKMKQGKKCNMGSVPLCKVQKIIRRKTSGFEKQSVVDIYLETRDGEKIELPMFLHLSVNEQRIISAIHEANPSIIISKESIGGSIGAEADRYGP